MNSAEAVGGILSYLNQREFEQCRSDVYHDRPFYSVGQRVHADYAGLQLSSLFQPIVRGDLDRDDTVQAYEALLAAHTVNGLMPLGHALAPQSVFALPNGGAEITTLDRLARTLHALNFLVQDPFPQASLLGKDGGVLEKNSQKSSAALHLNVDPHHLVAVSADHGRVFEQILRQCGLDPTAIVLEVPEHSIRNKVLLRTAIASWQARGYRIAIDNFGREHLQLQRVLDLHPNLIKIDRTLLYAAEQSQRACDVLARIVAKIQACKIPIVATGIETAAQHELAQRLDCEYLQGFFYGTPAQDCQTPAATSSAQRKYA